MAHPRSIIPAVILTAAALASGTAVLAEPVVRAPEPQAKPVDRTVPQIAGSPVDAKYRLYIAGLGLGEVRFQAVFGETGYTAVSRLETSGMINAFWRSEIDARSWGAFTGTTMRPEVYDSWYLGRRDRRQQVSIAYTGDLPDEVIAAPAYDVKPWSVTREESRGAVDPLSGFLHIASGLSATADQPCGGVTPVFDGRRRYDLVLSHVADETAAYPVYRGAVLKCRVEYRQVAGFKPKLVKEGREIPKVFLHLAKVPAESGRTLLMPLRIWSETSYGTAVIFLEEATVDGRALKKAVRQAAAQ